MTNDTNIPRNFNFGNVLPRGCCERCLQRMQSGGLAVHHADVGAGLTLVSTYCATNRVGAYTVTGNIGGDPLWTLEGPVQLETWAIRLEQLRATLVENLRVSPMTIN